MGVLNIKHRVVPRLLGDFGEVEIERRVVFPIEYHEPNGACAHLVHDVPQGHEGPGTLGHFDRLTGAKQAHELTYLDVEIGLAAGERGDRGPHALDVAAMVGAPDIDHGVEAAPDLVEVIGDVGGEICV